MAQASKEALCWQCRRATGWQAERTFRRVRRGGAVQLAPGIRVAACPKFERDRRERRQGGR